MDGYKPFLWNDFSGGWNPKWALNATQLQPNQSPSMVNVDYAAKYALTKRRGTVLIGDVTAGAGSIKSIFNFVKVDGTEVLIRSYSTFHQSLVAGVWTNFQTGLTADQQFDYASDGTFVYFGNAVNDFAKWDGTTVTTSAGNPKGNIFAIAFFKLFVAGVTAFPYRLYYSQTGVLDTFAGGTSGNTDFPGKIKSIRSFYTRDGGEALLVFIANGSLYQIDFDGSGILTKRLIRSSIGSVSHRATKQLENYNFVVDIFKNVRGVGYEQNLADVRASTRSIYIEDYLRTLDLEGSTAEYAYRQYLLAAQDPDGAQNNVELVYDELYDSWRLYTGHQVNHYTIYQNKVTYASASDLNVYQYDAGTYKDAVGSSYVPIYCRYDTKAFDANDPIRSKRLRYVKISGYISTGCQLTVKAYTDANLSAPIWSKTIDGAAAYVDDSLTYPWGSAVFGSIPFAGLGGNESSIEVRPFWVAIMANTANFNDIRLSFENYQEDVDFVITEVKPVYTLEAEERIPETNQL